MLDTVGGPYLHVAVGTHRWAYGMVLTERRAGRLAIYLHGSRMHTVDAMFDQFSAAYQFPYYFGENWAAFDECIGDLDWFAYPDRGYVV